MELLRDDLHGFSKPPKIPCRVIMNNSTISIFMSDNFGDINFSVTLQEVSVKKDSKDSNCLLLFN